MANRRKTMTVQQKRDRVAELTPLADEHRKLSSELTDAALDEAAAQLVGKYFKYPGNTYGGGPSAKRWTVYRAVLGVSKGNELACLEIQDDGQGSIRIDQSTHFVMNLRYPQGSGYHEITRAEFWRGLKRIESAANNAFDLGYLTR